MQVAVHRDVTRNGRYSGRSAYRYRRHGVRRRGTGSRNAEPRPMAPSNEEARARAVMGRA